MKVSPGLLGLAVVVVLSAGIRAASADTPRILSEEQVRAVIGALLKKPDAPLSEDPSCKADLNSPGFMSISAGLAEALIRASIESKPVRVTADCFVRNGFPLRSGQEYCRLAFSPAGKGKHPKYGLLFVMDWVSSSVVPHTVECF